VLEWYHLVQQARLAESAGEMRQEGQLGVSTLRVFAGIIFAVFVTFLGGLIYILFVPQGSTSIPWTFVLPVFVPSVLAPDVLWRLIKTGRRRQSGSRSNRSQH